MTKLQFNFSYKNTTRVPRIILNYFGAQFETEWATFRPASIDRDKDL